MSRENSEGTSNGPNQENNWVVGYAEWVIQWRWLVLLVTMGLAGLATVGVTRIEMKTEYRVFFSEDNPQLQAFDEVENIYTKNDNILFVLAPENGDVFSVEALQAVEELTAEAWKIPFAIRVDAVTNFQHTRAEGDELIVADLVVNPAEMSKAGLQRARQVAITDPRLLNFLVPEQAHVTGINVTVQFPGKEHTENTRSVIAARKLTAAIEREYPNLKVYLTGFAMLNNAFQEASLQDMQLMVPLMYGVIFLTMILLLRSVCGTFATGMVVFLSTGAGMGLAGWLGLPLTPPSSQAPTIILTLAVADSIHLLVTLLQQMRRGMEKRKAIVESLRVNMQPVFLTSLTTIIGFLSMNFSEVPPLNDLGNITAMGVSAAFVFSILLLPALIAVLPLRVKARKEAKSVGMDRFANWVIRARGRLLWVGAASVLLLGAFLPSNDLNDQFVNYFDHSMAFRRDTDFAMENLSGIYSIQFSLGASRSGGISDPEYLERLEAFSNWFRSQPRVVHVNTLSETMKVLNMNMHADDQAYYRLPESPELSAQYLLLYEMSLPYGLDLNNMINVDKSATRLTVTLENVTSKELRALVEAGEQWLRDNAPKSMFAYGVGPGVMFSYISDRNIKSMLIGTVLAIVLISMVLMVSLRTAKLGLFSIIPNLVPMTMGFGLWGMLVGLVNLGMSIVVGVTIGIVVDDTVHFLSKYLRARRELGYGAEEAVRYAFSTVGRAMVVTTFVLVAGFAVLSMSTFMGNADMARMAVITMSFALVADFIFLPPLLITLDEKILSLVKDSPPVHSGTPVEAA